jgi:hypothetical protein
MSSSRTGVASDLRRLSQPPYFRVSSGRSEPLSKNRGLQSSAPSPYFALDPETDRVYTPEQEDNGKPVARIVVYEAATGR